MYVVLLQNEPSPTQLTEVFLSSLFQVSSTTHAFEQGELVSTVSITQYTLRIRGTLVQYAVILQTGTCSERCSLSYKRACVAHALDVLETDIHRTLPPR